MHLRILILLLVAAALVSGCRTDFDINAEWKDITIVYGVLDKNNTVHQIKINKAFMGDGNALDMAKVYDSINYPYRLNVYLEEWKNESFTGRKILFDTLTLWGKPDGTFSSPKQLVYSTDTNISTVLNPECIYKLFIINPVTGKEITAETPVIGEISIKRPLPGSQFITFINNRPADIKWLTANYGRLYQVTIRFNYIEKDQNNIITYKSFDWDLGTIRTTSLQAGNEIGTSYLGSQFYMSVRSHIQPNPNVKRYAGKVNLIITVAGDDLATYIDVNKPSGGIIQEKPEYTNVTNGIGIFSSRLDKRFSYFLLPSSEDSLVSGQYTSHLGFNKGDPSTP